MPLVLTFGSLNRTMQYGNEKSRHTEIVGKEFKSYYVVWKLKKAIKQTQ